MNEIFENLNSDFPFVLEKTIHFKYNIEKVWKILRNLEILFILNSNKHFPPIVIKGNNTYCVGNEFEGIFLGIIPFIGKVIKVNNLPQIKKIEWYFKTSNGGDIKIKIKVYKVSKDDTTILLITFKSNNPKAIEFPNFYNFKSDNFIENINNNLNSSIVDLYQYEADIIPGEIEKLWNLFTNYKKLKEIYNEYDGPEININNFNKYQEVKINYKKNNKEGFFYLKIVEKNKIENCKKWNISYLVYGGEPYKISKQKCIYSFIKLNEKKCHLALIHEILEPMPTKIIQKISEKKKKLIKFLIKYFNNNCNSNKE
jgi:hypothetical protein